VPIAGVREAITGEATEISGEQFRAWRRSLGVQNVLSTVK